MVLLRSPGASNKILSAGAAECAGDRDSRIDGNVIVRLTRHNQLPLLKHDSFHAHHESSHGPKKGHVRLTMKRRLNQAVAQCGDRSNEDAHADIIVAEICAKTDPYLIRSDERYR